MSKQDDGEPTKFNPCPACPDGGVWNSDGPTGRLCPVCKGMADATKEAEGNILALPEPQTEPVAPPSREWTDEEIFRLARKNLSAEAVNAETITRWKDGVDIDEPSYGLLFFARALLGGGK